MPSPLAHLAVGYVIHRAYQPPPGPRLVAHVPLSLAAALGFALLPDVDSVAGILMGDLGRYHNGWTHSLAAGLGVSAIVGSVALCGGRGAARKWFVLALLCYGSHVVMDFLTIGRGVMALWPLSAERYASPIRLFYGLHWSQGWLSVRHLWTLLTELGFVAVLGAAVSLWDRLGPIAKAESSPVTQVDR
jgi:inner membrane protein